MTVWRMVAVPHGYPQWRKQRTDPLDHLLYHALYWQDWNVKIISMIPSFDSILFTSTPAIRTALTLYSLILESSHAVPPKYKRQAPAPPSVLGHGPVQCREAGACMPKTWLCCASLCHNGQVAYNGMQWLDHDWTMIWSMIGPRPSYLQLHQKTIKNPSRVPSANVLRGTLFSLTACFPNTTRRDHLMDLSVSCDVMPHHGQDLRVSALRTSGDRRLSHLWLDLAGVKG